MSKFSGKNDLFDYLSNIDLSKIRVYQKIDALKEQINVEQVKDLIPYSDYIPVVSVSSDGTTTYIIGIEDYNKQNDREFYQHIEKRIRDDMKKDGENFTLFLILKIFGSLSDDRDNIREIYKRILSDGEYIEVSDLHSNHYRYKKTLLRDKMIEVGYTQEDADLWCYQDVKSWGMEKINEVSTNVSN